MRLSFGFYSGTKHSAGWRKSSFPPSRDRNIGGIPVRGREMFRGTRKGFLMKTKIALLAAAAFAAMTLGAGAAEQLNGAGGTAIYPVLQVWAAKYATAKGTE